MAGNTLPIGRRGELDAFLGEDTEKPYVPSGGEVRKQEDITLGDLLQQIHFISKQLKEMDAKLNKVLIGITDIRRSQLAFELSMPTIIKSCQQKVMNTVNKGFIERTDV